MNFAPSLIERVQEVCRDIDHARTLEALYENLARYLAKISGVSAHDAGASAFMSIVKYSVAGHTFQVANGMGKYAAAAGSMVLDETILEHLSNAIGQRSNYYSRDAVTFCFPHPENFAILVHVELAQEIDTGAQELLKFVNDKVASSIRTHSLSKQTVRTGRAMVIALASLAEHKDQDTGDHIMRVAIMTDEIVQVLGELGYYTDKITPEFERHVSTASILHDVGKISIPDSILKKPGKLDAEERRIIETHTLKGKKVLEKASRILDDYNYLLNLSCEIALHHHEHYNGQGYPAQIAGQGIPLSARIVGLVDVFDALTSERSYKKAWTDQEAIAYNVLMDAHHRIFFEMIKEFSKHTGKNDQEAIKRRIEFLLEYAAMHLGAEEKLMRQANYPELDEHKAVHDAFVRKLLSTKESFDKDPTSVTAEGILEVMQDWLVNHIVGSDKRYMPYVQKLQG